MLFILKRALPSVPNLSLSMAPWLGLACNALRNFVCVCVCVNCV